MAATHRNFNEVLREASSVEILHTSGGTGVQIRVSKREAMRLFRATEWGGQMGWCIQPTGHGSDGRGMLFEPSHIHGMEQGCWLCSGCGQANCVDASCE